jgi:hypothetical protein
MHPPRVVASGIFKLATTRLPFSDVHLTRRNGHGSPLKATLATRSDSARCAPARPRLTPHSPRVIRVPQQRLVLAQERACSSEGRFTVETIDDAGVVLLLGEKRARTPIRCSVLEGVGTTLAGGGWMTIGSVYDTSAVSGTLDAYLKRFIDRATAGWAAALLEGPGVVQIDRGRPSRVRLR